MHKLKGIFFFLCLSIIWANPALAQPLEVDVELAKQIVDNNANGGEKGYKQALDTLDKLDPQGLAKLQQLIEDDLNSSAGIIVNPPARAEQCLAYLVLNEIKLRLGTLRYDRVVDGYFGAYNSSGSCITYYDFATDEGEVFEVYTSVYTLKPVFRYFANELDYVRLYLRIRTTAKGFVLREVVKLEMLQDNSSAPEKDAQKVSDK